MLFPMNVQNAMGTSQFIYTKEMKVTSYLSRLVCGDECNYENIKALYWPDMAPLISASRRQSRADLHGFEANLIYTLKLFSETLS